MCNKKFKKTFKNKYNGTKAQHHLPVHTADGLCLRQGCPCSHSWWTVLEARLSLFTQVMDCAWGKAVPVHTAHGLCAWDKTVPVHTLYVLETRLSLFTHFLYLKQGCPCSHSLCAWSKAVPVQLLCLSQGCPCSHRLCAWDKLSLFPQHLCLRQGCPCSHSSCAWDKAVPVPPAPVLETRLSLLTQLLCLRQGCPFWHSSCAWDKAVPFDTAPVLETKLSLLTQLLCLRQSCPFWHSSCAWDKAVPFDTAPVLETRLSFSYLTPTSVGGLRLSLQWVSNRSSSTQHNPISANGIMILSPAVCTLTWAAWPSPSTGLSSSVVRIGEVARVCRPHDRCSLRVQWHLAGIIWGPKIQLYLTESVSWTSLWGWGGGSVIACCVWYTFVCVWSMCVHACTLHDF